MAYEQGDRRDAVRQIVVDEVGLPYMARVADYYEPGLDRDEQIARLREADAEADAANDAFIDRIIAAALSTDWPSGSGLKV